MLRHERQTGLGTAPFSDVLMRCDPSAPEHWLEVQPNRPAVAEIVDNIVRFELPELPVESGHIVRLGHRHESSASLTMSEDVRQVCSDTRLIGRQPVNLAKRAVAAVQPLVTAEKSETLGDVIK